MRDAAVEWLSKSALLPWNSAAVGLDSAARGLVEAITHLGLVCRSVQYDKRGKNDR